VTPLIASVFVASLLGSVHCAGMCGGFVCAYSAGAPRRAHLLYHGARLAAYLTLGAVAGVVGAGVTQAGALLSLRDAAALLAGTLMVLWGVGALLAARGWRVPWRAAPGAGAPLLQPLTRRAAQWTPSARAATFGGLTALLPCGWLWAFVVTAAGTGAVDRAMLVMAVFWAGSVPALLAVAAGVQRVAGRWRARIPVVTASSVLLMGLLTVALVLRPPSHHAHAASAVAAPAPTAVSSTEAPDAPHRH
jgi:sulfite exporter TauE/SafE